MRVPRYQVTSALFTLLQGSYPWVTADARMQFPEDLGSGMQPAMFLVKPSEHHSQDKTFAATTYRLQYFAYILAYSNGAYSLESPPVEQLMDDMLDSIESALAPALGEKQTLGGLVEHCWIDGTIWIDTPVLFQQCAMWVPITVTVGI